MKKLFLAICLMSLISFTGCQANQINVDTQTKELEAYFQDIKEQTNLAITDEQKKLILNYISKNPIKKLEPSETKIRRHKFNGIRKKLISEWEQRTKQIWPKYDHVVLSKKGRVDREKGTNYDAHHILEISGNGPNLWWNMHPAAFPNAHQNGIHRKGSPARKLFDDDIDD